MGYRTAKTVHVVLMIWISLIFLGAWLPFLRSLMDGASYQWGARMFGMEFGGAGLSGDFWYALMKAAMGLAFLWFGWRQPNGKVRYAIAAYLALVFADTMFNVLTAPEAFRFRGDTLGINMSLAFVATLLDGSFLALGLWWVARAPELAVAPMGLGNRILIGAAVLLLPVQYYLLSTGVGQQSNDVLGVLLTMVGWGLFSAGLASRGGKGAQPEAAMQSN